jgi:hypothetical protein
LIVQAELADTWRSVTCTDVKHRRASWCPKTCDAGSPVVWIKRVNPGTVRDAVKYVTKAADLIEAMTRCSSSSFLHATRNSSDHADPLAYGSHRRECSRESGSGR